MNAKLLAYLKGKFVSAAKEALKSPQALKTKLDKAADMLGSAGVTDKLGKSLSDVKALIRMIRYWIERKYTDISPQSLLYTVAAILYFVTPTDFLPDFILGLGFLDDIAVLKWVINQIRGDLEKFKLWEQNTKDNSKDDKR